GAAELRGDSRRRVAVPDALRAGLAGGRSSAAGWSAAGGALEAGSVLVLRYLGEGGHGPIATCDHGAWPRYTPGHLGDRPTQAHAMQMGPHLLSVVILGYSELPRLLQASTRSSHTYRPRHRSADPSAAGSGALWFYPGLGVGIPGAWLAAVGLALLVVLVLVARHESWRAALLTMITGAPLAARLRLLRLTSATLHLLQAPGVLAWTLGISVGSLACTSLALWTTARALSLDLGFLVFLVVLPVITMAALVPSINGIGVRETSMVVVLRGLV